MIPRVLLCVVFIAGLQGQAARADDPAIKTTEQTLAAVLRWEVLWNDSPKGFRMPSDGSLTLAINALPDSVSYCSHQAGVCVTYRIDGYRNWEGVKTGNPQPDGSDIDALLAFLGKQARKPPRPPGAPVVLGQGGFSGSPVAGSGIMWTTKIALGTRAEIVKEYQELHPADIESLKNWLRSPATSHSGVRGMTIACFAPSDPMVYYLVDRSVGAPVIMAVFWDKDRQEWVVASSFERNQAPEKFDEMRRTIESVSCSTVTFQ